MGAFCYTLRVTVYTVGHSTRSLDDFLALFAAHGVAGIGDVRSYPASRRPPHIALAAERPTAVLCAEAVPWRCHRQLIADALVVRGVAVIHLLAPDAVRHHTLSPLARVAGGRLVYDAGELPLVASRARRLRP